MRPGVRGGHPEDGLNRGCAQNNVARATAGKVGAALTPEPVIVDLKAIVGSLLRVQAASHSAAPRNQSVHHRSYFGIFGSGTVAISFVMISSMSRPSAWAWKFVAIR